MPGILTGMVTFPRKCGTESLAKRVPGIVACDVRAKTKLTEGREVGAVRGVLCCFLPNVYLSLSTSEKAAIFRSLSLLFTLVDDLVSRYDDDVVEQFARLLLRNRGTG